MPCRAPFPYPYIHVNADGTAREFLPRGMPVDRAPADDPLKPLRQAAHIAWLRSKGIEVIENNDGSFTMLAPRAAPL
jgi:hypothetical protein